MTIELRDAVNGDGLMDIQGRGFHAIDTLNTARLTTVPAEAEDFLEQAKNKAQDADYDLAMSQVPSALKSWQSAGSSLTTAIRRACELLLVEFVQDDSDQPDRALAVSLKYLIDQMEEDQSYVTPSVVGLSLATGADNIGDVAICYTERRGDGRPQENLLAETIEIEVVSDASAVSPTLSFHGEGAVANRLSQDWPAGSGSNRRIAAVNPAGSLLSNGDFQDTTIRNVPDDWFIATGTPDTSVRITDPEVQTVVISGTPTGGSYVLQWENADGVVRATDPLAYNATSSTVQAALRTIPGLESVTVAGSGTTPNLTHTVTFALLAADINQLTSVSHFEGRQSPTITHATTVVGDDGAFRGRALRLDSDGSKETTLYHSIALAAETVYFCHLRIKRTTNQDESSSVSASSDVSSSSSASSSSQSSASSSSSESSSSESSSSSSESSSSSQSSSSSASSQDAEELRIEIVDGIGGNVLLDGDGYENVMRIDAGAISTDRHDSEFFSFRVARSVTQPVYLRIRIVNPVTAGDTIYIDEVAVVQATELYRGGPFVAAFSGKTPAVNEDAWDLVSTNDRAGKFQEWYNRAFDMAGKGYLLPSAGVTLIPNSLIG